MAFRHYKIIRPHADKQERNGSERGQFQTFSTRRVFGWAWAAAARTSRSQRLPPVLGNSFRLVQHHQSRGDFAFQLGVQRLAGSGRFFTDIFRQARVWQRPDQEILGDLPAAFRGMDAPDFIQAVGLGMFMHPLVLERWGRVVSGPAPHAPRRRHFRSSVDPADAVVEVQASERGHPLA